MCFILHFAVIFNCALFYILFLKCHVNVYKTKQFLLYVWCSDFFYLKKHAIILKMASHHYFGSRIENQDKS